MSSASDATHGRVRERRPAAVARFLDEVYDAMTPAVRERLPAETGDYVNALVQFALDDLTRFGEALKRVVADNYRESPSGERFVLDPRRRKGRPPDGGSEVEWCLFLDVDGELVSVREPNITRDEDPVTHATVMSLASYESYEVLTGALAGQTFDRASRPLPDIPELHRPEGIGSARPGDVALEEPVTAADLAHNVRPAARELLQLAVAMSLTRGAQQPTDADVVLATLYRPAHSTLDVAQLEEGAAYELVRAIPGPANERIVSAVRTAGVDVDELEERRRQIDVGDVVFPGIARRADELAGRVRATDLWSHHVVAAALVTGPLPPAVSAALDVTADELRVALRRGIARRWSRIEDLVVWDEVLLPPGDAYPSFNQDDTRGDDLLSRDKLDIAPHVRAMALLMASKELRPPLAIGLFGDWGSGKSYFMRSLRQEVDRLTRQARASDQPQRDLPIFRNVAQIEFNAWHYVDADLWASLTDYVFSNLRIEEHEDLQNLEDRRRLYVQQLKESGAALRQIETERQRLQEQVELKEAEVARLRLESAKQQGAVAWMRAAVTADATTKNDVDELRRSVGLPAVGGTAVELHEALVESAEVVEEARSTFNILAGRYGRGWFIAAICALLLGPAVLLFSNLTSWSSVSRLAATIAAFLASAAALLRLGTAATRSVLGRIESIDAELRKSVETAPEVRRQKRELCKLLIERRKASRKEDSLRAQLAEIELTLEKLSPGRLLADFILSRRNSDDYRKHLGLASLIRRDFEMLAAHIDEFNAWLETDDGAQLQISPRPTTRGSTTGADGPGPSEEEFHLNRIVLYIDDLDRCPPATVVQVLQAVHLLLAFPLFVVVVGVDSRWLARSLEKHYEGLLGVNVGAGQDDGLRSATPDDYLEKIFQIPFWLRPMPPNAQDGLLSSLTGISAQAPTTANAEETTLATTDPLDAAAAPATGVPQPSETEAHEAIHEDATADDSAVPPSSAAASTFDLRPVAITVTQPERDLMQAVRPLLGRSPRSLTRFVNVFRLTKAVESYETRQTTPPGGDDDARPVQIVLLAIVTGLPEISRPLLTALRSTQGQTLEQVVDEATRRAHPLSEERAEWERLTTWLKDHSEWSTRSIDGVWRAQVNRISRYSYRIEHA
jgi:hypothetical protein